MNSRSSLAWLVALAAIAFALFAWTRSAAAAKEKEAAAARAAELQRSLADARAESENVRSSANDLSAQKSELMRLRNEVTQLRGSSQAVARLETENARLRQEIETLRSRRGEQAQQANAEQRFPREQWAFSGYATPEAALVSSMWALKEGQLNTYAAGLSPAEAEHFAKQAEGKTEQQVLQEQHNMSQITGLRISEKQQVSPEEVVMKVWLEGPGGSPGSMTSVRLTRVGQEWKFGYARNNDPLQFYRQNPELMKRYFPHLSQEGQQPQTQPQPQQPQQ
jgi:hypothetical protein